MTRLTLLFCVCTLLASGVAGVAHANQVETPAPPANPPAAPADQPPPAQPPPAQPQPSDPAPQPSPVYQAPPANPQPGYQGGGAVQYDGSATWRASQQGTETHDGFFFRGAIGFGYGFWTEDVERPVRSSLKLDGLGAGLDLAVGAIVTDNLAVHASLFATAVTNPNVELDGEDLGTADDASISGVGLGAGVTYYVMPINVYLSASVGIGGAQLTIDQGSDDETRIKTDPGIAFEALVGKEWWVNSQWGLGVALQVVHVNVPDGDDVRLRGTGVHLMFSATYN